MRFESLQAWLSWQETLHPNEIDLGLERVAIVRDRLAISFDDSIVIIIAGTNGKGSAVAMYESILLAAGYRVGAYTSPHLLTYNERIRVNGVCVADELICDSFQRIDTARQDTSLTYFEFGTLAALDIFSRVHLDVVLLEVGLGGRLDAVNVIDADLVHFASIAIDHEQWLGSDRETIAAEKAGVLRQGVAAVCADQHPPAALLQAAKHLSVDLKVRGRDFFHTRQGEGFGYNAGEIALTIPLLGADGDYQQANASSVIAGLHELALADVSVAFIQQGLARCRIAGRLQTISSEPTIILDVAHNPDAAEQLLAALTAEDAAKNCIAVVGMMKDKDIHQVLAIMSPLVQRWCFTELASERAASAEDLCDIARQLPENNFCGAYANVAEALQSALHVKKHGKQNSKQVSKETGDVRIVVFGSFYTVADAIKFFQANLFSSKLGK
ncbi:MAG: bifunctional tetrahydrofolate synthase/dihydrofolate synthase [Gammaproteobacteria bacterium]|nr:bifunctional tetrahydrofolate synthase/dihydrofolate synthase [Gammaproteobacteria bacterium]